MKKDKIEKKIEKKDEFDEKNSKILFDEISEICRTLVYSGESDFPILPISLGKVKTISLEKLKSFLRLEKEQRLEFLEFEDFFEPLLREEDWFNEEEKAKLGRFEKLKRIMAENLRDLCFVKKGKIKQEIYVIGIDGDDNLIGFQTKATET